MLSFQKTAIVVSLMIASHSVVNGQGCSDAGFCTINSFKPNSKNDSKTYKHHAKLGSFWGTADNSISVFGAYLEYATQLSKVVTIDAKLTSIAQSGNSISTFGLADAFLNASFAVKEKLRLTLGTKIPLSTANKLKDNLALPMDYQASLGTFDLIFGIGYEIKKLQLTAAIQQPLSQNNNQFFAGDYPSGSKLRSFQSTKNFRRAGDVLVRIAYPFKLNSKFKLTPSLLPIYHLANDKFTDPTNVEYEIVGSRGLTLNANTFLDYEIDQKNAVQLNLGVPLVIRDARPDGLTRGFIVSLEYKVKF